MGYIGTFPRNTTTVMGLPIGKINDLNARVSTLEKNSASGFTTLPPTETPNGTITVFTFSTATAKPTFIISDNAMMQATTKSGTVNWTWNNGAKQATMVIAPSDDIIGLK